MAAKLKFISSFNKGQGCDEMSEYENVHFDKWQDLAKAVIDGGEFFVKNNVGQYFRLSFDGECFNCKLKQWVENAYIKKQPTLAELIAIKPRLCWAWDRDHQLKKYAVIVDSGEYPSGFTFQDSNGVRWKNAQMLTDEEIKQFLSGE